MLCMHIVMRSLVISTERTVTTFIYIPVHLLCHSICVSHVKVGLQERPIIVIIILT